jgi:hypothetical protein
MGPMGRCFCEGGGTSKLFGARMLCWAVLSIILISKCSFAMVWQAPWMSQLVPAPRMGDGADGMGGMIGRVREIGLSFNCCEANVFSSYRSRYHVFLVFFLSYLEQNIFYRRGMSR